MSGGKDNWGLVGIDEVEKGRSLWTLIGRGITRTRNCQ